MRTNENRATSLRELELLHIETLNEFQWVRSEECFHLGEIRRWRQVAEFAPLVISRQAVISSTLDIKSEKVKSKRGVLLLEQVVS